MRFIKYLALASLVAFAACDEETPPPTQVLTGTVTVTVTAGGTGVAGVTVSLGAAGTQPAATSAQGVVTFSNVAAGTYVASVSGLPADLACPQTAQPVTVAGGQTTAIQFACNVITTSSISGSVTNQDGTARANASITITRTLPAPAGAPVTVTTGTNGQYSLTGLRSGTYTVSLPITANCTTAANTQTVTIAAGEARVVNFTCTTAPPPPPLLPATVAIESITALGPGGVPIPIPDNSVAGVVNVNVDVSEGDQRVTRVELYLGGVLVGTHTRTVAAPDAEQQLADFEITFVVNTAAFNATTGAVNFRNVAMPPDGPGTFFEVRIYTAAGGATTAAATGRRTIGLSNVDFVYMRVTPERRVNGGTAQNSLAVTTGLEWWSGNLTVDALPVIYSATVISSLTIRLGAFSPLSIPTGDEDDVYGIGNVTDVLTRAIYTNGDAGDCFPGSAGCAVPFETNNVMRTLTAAPWSTTLLGANSITAGQNGDRGTGNIEDVGIGAGLGGIGALNLSVTSIASAGTGPVVNGIIGVCSDGRVPSFVLFPGQANGCSNGQPAQPIRFDTFAPLIDQMDQSLRWSSSYTAAGVGIASNGVTRWAHDGKSFTFTTSGTNTTTPRATDRGTGTTGTFWAFRAGRATSAMTSVTTAGQAPGGDTFDNNTNYLNASVTDIGGTSRTLWNNNTSSGATGTGTGNNSIATLEGAAAVGLMPANGGKWGLDSPDPCFTTNGVDCADGLIGTLRANADVIGNVGEATLGGGGTRTGSTITSQRMDRLNAAGGDPGWPPVGAVTGDYGHAIVRIRREGSVPGSPGTAFSQTQRCWVGVIDDGDCVEAGGGGTTASGFNGSLEFLGAGARYSTIASTTGTVSNVTNDRAGTTLDMSARADLGVGFFNVQMRPVDAAGNQGPLFFRRFVRDMMAPISAGVIYPVTVAPGGSVTVSSIAQDDLALARSEAYLAFGGGAMMSFKQNEQQIMAFPTGTGYNDGFPYTTSFNPSATFGFTSALFVGANDVAPDPATNFVFRIFDFGRNAAEATSTGVPAVNPAPAAAPTITSATMAGSVSAVCWDTDADGCPTNQNSVSLTFTVTSSVPQQVPFNRVEFYVGRDVDNSGVPDTDAAVRTMWASLGVSGGSAVGNTFTWTRVVTGEQLATASGRSTIADPAAVSNWVYIRVVGYMPNGQAFTVTTAAGLFCTPAGADAPCVILLSRD